MPAGAARVAEPTKVEIRTETITLGDFLKWARAAASGGEAKRLIASGDVRVNGAVEARRGRTLRRGDRVEVGRARYEVA